MDASAHTLAGGAIRGGYRVTARPRSPRQLAVEAVLRRAAELAERGICAFGLFVYSSAFFPLVFAINGITEPVGSANYALRAVNTSIYLMILPWALWHGRSVLRAAMRNPWIPAFLLFALASVAWSVAPDWTVRRGSAFALTTAFGIYIAGRFDSRDLLKLMAWAFGAAAVTSLVFGIALPSIGREVEIHVGAWRGVFPQKNNLGQIMVLSTMVFLLLARTLDRRRWLAWSGAALSAGLVILSTSKTALVILFVLGALTYLFRALRWHYTLVVPSLIGTVMAVGGLGLAVLQRSEQILLAMGKDPTLTGRTGMWEILLDAVRDRPLGGYGYSAFWIRDERSPSARVFDLLQWETPHAHNGFLDLALQLGLVGLAIFLISYLVAARRSVLAIRANRDPSALWPLVYLAFTVLYNVTESAIAGQHSVYWVLYVAAVCGVVRHRPAHTAATEAMGPAAAPSPRSPALAGAR